MASDLHFMEFIGDQLRGLAPVSWRKMFGEYALYHQAKVVGFVPPNQTPQRKAKNDPAGGT